MLVLHETVVTAACPVHSLRRVGHLRRGLHSSTGKQTVTSLFQPFTCDPHPCAKFHIRRSTQSCRSAMPDAAAISTSMADAVRPEFVELANRLADAAAEITVPLFRSAIIVDAKSDRSPVTQADREAERVMRSAILEAFPSHSVYGEEFGLQVNAPGGEWLWVLDPIDGTKSFITGKPLWGTLISLLHWGVPVLGVIDQPITKERWIGISGQLTELNGKPLRVRSCDDIGQAYLYATTPHMFYREALPAFERVRDAVQYPMYGCDCYAYGLLACGFVDLVVEADLKAFDYMALVPVVQGAGGIITDWKGQQLRWPAPAASGEYSLDGLPGEVVAAGDANVHAKVVELLAWTQ